MTESLERNNATHWTGKAIIDGGEPVTAELIETQQVIDISTQGAEPDPSWSTVDEAGHFHARSTDGTYPTLDRKSEHRDCDGGDGSCDDDCEGYSVTVWSCRACGEWIEPGMIPGPHYRTMPGMTDWRLKYRAGQPPTGQMGQSVSVRFEPYAENKPLLFGFAIVGDISVEGDVSGRVTASVDLLANGALGRQARSVPEDGSTQVALGKLRKAAA